MVEDCQQAVLCTNTLTKAYWRGAKAYVSLGKFEEAAAFCELGLSKADPESKPLQKVLKQAKEGVRAREQRKTEAARKREKQRASREQVS